MHRNLPGLIRAPVFAALFIVSCVVFGIDVYLEVNHIAWVHPKHNSDGAFIFPFLGGVTCIATVIFLAAVLGVRKHSNTGFEIFWLALIWGGWLATAIITYSDKTACSGTSYPCSAFRAVEAFNVIALAVLAPYWLILLFSSLIASWSGQKDIWDVRVMDADFSADGDRARAQQLQTEAVQGIQFNARPAYYERPDDARP